MAVTIDTICARSLVHIGKRPIASLNDPNPEARQCKLLWLSVLEEVLRAHEWRFATKIVALAQISGQTIPGWQYLYSEPAQCLFIRKVFSDTTVKNPDPCEFSKLLSPTTNVRAIAVDISPAYAEFTVLVVDPNLWDPDFTKAYEYKLAAALSLSLTGDKAIGTAMLQIYQSILDSAKPMNRSESYVKQKKTSSYLEAR